MSLERKLQLVRKCVALSDNESEEMMRIIHENAATYSSNNNGNFLNLSNASDKMLGDMERFIEFAHTQRTQLDAYDTMKSNLNRVMSQINETTTANNNTSATNDICCLKPVEKSRQERLQIVTDLIHSKKEGTRFQSLKKRFAKPTTTTSAPQASTPVEAILLKEAYIF